MNMSEKIDQLALAFSKYQAKVQNPSNSAKNPFLKNKYAPLNEILNQVRPELSLYGLSVTQLVGGEDKISVTTILLHESGQYISDTVSITPESSKGLSVAQNAGVVITYLRRYGLTAILSIAGEDDTDGHGTEPKQEPKAQEIDEDSRILRDNIGKSIAKLAPKLSDKQVDQARDLYKKAGHDKKKLNDLIEWVENLAQTQESKAQQLAEKMGGEVVTPEDVY